jgi:hypothetical protein
MQAAVAIEGEVPVFLNGTDAGPLEGVVSTVTVNDTAPVAVPVALDEAAARAAVAADGRGVRDTAGRERVALAPGESFDAVLLIAGQSMSTNAGETPYAPRRAVANLNVYDGEIYAARDPLLGTSEDRGSVASRLGELMIERGVARRVLLVPIGIGGSTMREWAPGGPLFARFVVAQRALAARGLAATHVLWAQGESDAVLDTTRLDWLADFQAMTNGLRALGIAAPVLVARSTFCHETRPNSAAIREAQADAVDPANGILAGPDTDTIGPELRFDRCHFNAEGLARAAALWADCLSGPRPPRP